MEQLLRCYHHQLIIWKALLFWLLKIVRILCLPNTICSLKLLEFLDLSWCSNYDNLPENLGNLKGLEELYLSGTAIKELSSSTEGVTALTYLTLNDCKNLVCLPSTICSLNLLQCLDLSGCLNCGNLPENLGNPKGLKKFYLSGTTIKELPSSIDNFKGNGEASSSRWRLTPQLSTPKNWTHHLKCVLHT